MGTWRPGGSCRLIGKDPRVASVRSKSKLSVSGHGLMLAPMLLFVAMFFVYPMVDMVARGLGSPDHFPTLEQYERMFSKTLYLRILWNTFEISASVTLLTLALSYPMAYLIATAGRATSLLLTVCTLVPFFTSLLVRTYGWMVVLSPDGLLNQALAEIGLSPVQLLYNRGGVLIGMTYTLLPYMILTLSGVFRGIDPTLMRAAGLFGASNFRAFLHVFLPLSMPGVLGGSLLVFLMAVGYFITPALIGGGKDQMIAMVIYEQIDKSLNWNFAAALSTLLFVSTVLVFFAYARLFGLGKALESKR